NIMFVAAWSFDIQYGAREEAMRMMKETQARVEGSGWKAKRTRILAGSIGAPESRMILEHEIESLADLEASWNALHARQGDFQKMVGQMKNVILSGSPRWEIYRIIES